MDIKILIFNLHLYIYIYFIIVIFLNNEEILCIWMPKHSKTTTKPVSNQSINLHIL